MSTFVILQSKAEKFLELQEKAQKSFNDMNEYAYEIFGSDGQIGQRTNIRHHPYYRQDGMNMRVSHPGGIYHNGMYHNGDGYQDDMYGNRMTMPQSPYYPQFGERSGWMLQPVPPMYPQQGW